MACSTNGSPDSHSSLPSHQFRNPFTGPTLSPGHPQPLRPMCQDRRMPPVSGETTCLIAGGGPAGMMLGLLLARAGVKVTVLEKHADFLRDFRGDTVPASTLRLLDELGLGSRFNQMPHRLIETAGMKLQDEAVDLDFS